MDAADAQDADLPNRRRGLAVAFASTFFELVGYFMLAPLLVLTLAERGVGAGAIGRFSALNWIGVLLMTPVAGRIAHALGLRAAFWLSGALPLLAAFGFMLTDALGAWFAIYLTMGLASGLRWIVSEAMVAALAPDAQRGRIVGTFQTMIGLTFIVGPALLPLAGTAGARPFLASIALLGLGLACALALPALPRRATDEGRREAQQNPAPAGVAGIWQALRAAPAVMAAGFVGGVFEAGIAGLLPVYGVTLGFSAATAALLVSASGLGSTLLMLPAGALADRYDRRKVLVGSAALLFAGTLLLPIVPRWPACAWAIAFVWGGAGGSLYTLAIVDIGTRLTGAALVNATAVLIMSYTLGGTVAPVLGGHLLEHAPRVGFPLALAALAATSLVALAAALRRERRANDGAS